MALPRGTVTLLMGDIEGSTRLLDALGADYAALLATHDAIVEAAVTQHGGQIVDREGGDAFLAVFTGAEDAVAATVAAQRGLGEAAWPQGVSVRVRMGVHTGRANLERGRYIGMAVHEVARVCAAAHGGQVLVSPATRPLLDAKLLGDVELVDLGEHALKDIARPMRLFQVAAPGLAERFPSLRAASRAAGRLPVAETPLVGRESGLREAARLVQEPGHRLLTLTGPGGIGKTRLAIAVAERLRGSFADGVFVIELAALEDAGLLASTIARELGLALDDGEPVAALRDHLRDRRALLVLDNFEQLLSGAPLLADLLDAAPELRLLVTSRATLNLLAERLYEVPALALPSAAGGQDPETLAASPAVALFVERARAVDPRFAITRENAGVVREICARLDGLPLALELAASWVKLLGPRKLLARLASRLPLLTRGPRDLPARQQSLRGTIDWSYQLLDPDAQRLFRRLGVFAGGWTLEAAEELCGDDVLHQLATLLDHSLLQQRVGRSGEPRFFMLQTIREYALERLAAEAEEDALRRRHATWSRALVDQAEPHLWGAEQEEWLCRLDDEHDNLRAALGWSLRSCEEQLALELAAGAALFWVYRGYLAEGRDWLEQALALGASQSAVLRAAALRGLTTIARLQGDYANAEERGEEALALSRQSDDLAGIVRALTYLAAVVLARDRRQRAAALLNESVALGRKIGGIDLALATMNRADLALTEGDYEQTIELSHEAAEMFRHLGNAEGLATSLFNFASALLRQGRHADALRSLLESLTLFKGIGFEWGIAQCLENVAAMLAAEGSLTDAAQLLGAADALLESSGGERGPPELEAVQSTVTSLRRHLPSATFQTEYAKGRSLSRDQAIALARRAPELHVHGDELSTAG